MTQSDFDFSRYNGLLKAATRSSTQRRSGTVFGTVSHGIVHTPSPDSTIHHVVSGACPHPNRELADRGDYYMIAYVSAPIEWLNRITLEFCETWDVSFMGPAGFVQKLPPALHDIELILGARYYIGFDWLYLARTDIKSQQVVRQPEIPYIHSKLVNCMTALRALEPRA